MDYWMENLLRDLNSISRMAVLEQAYQTEKMLCNYSKILKYRWSHENKTVTASMESDIIKMVLELYQTKWKEGLTFETTTTLDTKSIFIPHYTILSFLSFIMEYLEKSNRKSIHVEYSVNKQEEKSILTLLFTGTEDFLLLEDAINKQTSMEYNSINSSRLRWDVAFGKQQITINTNDRNYLKIQFRAFDYSTNT